MSIAGAYRLGPETGRLLVNTTRTGLGAKAGHDLTIEVTRWHGHARVDTAVPANSSVNIQVDVDSFQVRQGTGGVKPLTDADRAEISKTLKEVLHTAQHPTITFRSRRVAGSLVGRPSSRADGDSGPTRHFWRPQAQGRGQGRLWRGSHPRRLTALGRV